MQKAKMDPLFYLRFALFQLRERFNDLGSSLAYIVMYPFFVWLLTQMWERFNASQGNYSKNEVYVYLAITELLFMGFMRSSFLQRFGSDFSLSLARPRSWLWMGFFGQVGTTSGTRLIYFAIACLTLPLLGVPGELMLSALGRLLLLLPLLGIAEALLANIMASAQVLWFETKYFMLPLSKIFLALGGVFGPLIDYAEPGRSLFMSTPAADLFFQVGHYCVKGSFYQLSELAWLMRILIWISLFGVINMVFFRYAKTKHQSFGG